MKDMPPRIEIMIAKCDRAVAQQKMNIQQYRVEILAAKDRIIEAEENKAAAERQIEGLLGKREILVKEHGEPEE